MHVSSIDFVQILCLVMEMLYILNFIYCQIASKHDSIHMSQLGSCIEKLNSSVTIDHLFVSVMHDF